MFITSCKRFYVPDDHYIRQTILADAHDAPHAGHASFTKTYECVARLFWWPRIRTDVHDYVTHCDSCQRNKARHGKAPGHLQPIPVPDRKFHGITMDLIVKLPPTASTTTYDSILVIADKLSKMVRLIPCQEAMTAAETVSLIHSHWFSLHGFPEQVVSDRGTHFNKFTSTLLASLGIKQSLSTAYHPQTAGQTERTNRVVEDMLRHYVSPTQNDWHKYLPFVEFAINNSKHEATGLTPFF
jgi:hypothetical protein